MLFMNELEESFIQDIARIWKSARSKAYTLVNRAMIDCYWEIGRRIVEEEQKGYKKALYGSFLLRELAKQLTQQLDKQLDERELRKMRQFYTLFPIRDAVRPELTWSHYRILLRIEHEGARNYYLQEAARNAWGTRLLERNVQSAYYERIISHQVQAPSAPVPDKRHPPIKPEFLIKDPYLFNFLDLPYPASMSESDLETALIGKIQQLLMEMGSGFAFVARQYCVTTDTRRYYLDLVFYNYLLKSFFIADLKIGPLTHQDIGQMDMYRRMFDDLKRIPGDNPTIGIILCTEKDDTLVKYSGLDENKHLFASRYQLVLPTEKELSDELKKITQA
jgi:predicted nuclease of restriction endonuclease-like (RecB) superfamily